MFREAGLVGGRPGPSVPRPPGRGLGQYLGSGHKHVSSNFCESNVVFKIKNKQERQLERMVRVSLGWGLGGSR